MYFYFSSCVGTEGPASQTPSLSYPLPNREYYYGASRGTVQMETNGATLLHFSLAPPPPQISHKIYSTLKTTPRYGSTLRFQHKAPVLPLSALRVLAVIHHQPLHPSPQSESSSGNIIKPAATNTRPTLRRTSPPPPLARALPHGAAFIAKRFSAQYRYT